MPAPGEYKTVQARISAYAQEIGWSFVSREEAERRRRFDPAGATPEERARKSSLFFGDLLHSQVRAFNPKYKDAEGALVGEFQRFHSDIYGNRDFLTALLNQHKFCRGRPAFRALRKGAHAGAPLRPGDRMQRRKNNIYADH